MGILEKIVFVAVAFVRVVLCDELAKLGHCLSQVIQNVLVYCNAIKFGLCLSQPMRSKTSHDLL